MSDRLITLFLIDDDGIFRLGLATALTPVADLKILAQGNSQEVYQRLQEQIPDLIVLDPAVSGWEWAINLRQQYPQIRICLLSAGLSPEQLLKAQNSGIEGYCPKGVILEELINTLRQIASGETVWPRLPPYILESSQKTAIGQQQWLITLSQSGLKQIDLSINQVNEQLNKNQLSWLDWFFWTGRRRELLAARWLVRHLVTEEVPNLPELPPTQPQENPPLPIAQTAEISVSYSPRSLSIRTVFDHILAQIQLGLENGTYISLEIDILQPDKLQELLYLVFDQVKKIVAEFPLLNFSPEQLKEKRSLILQKIWSNSIQLFLELNYPNKNELIDLDLIKEIIEQESLNIRQDILDKIPFTSDLLSYLIFQENLLVEGVAYRPNSPEAINRAELLLQNLIIHISNGVIAAILNNFSDMSIIADVLYNKKMNSPREIAKFRNDLSWKYRKYKYWEEPKYIFESKHQLFCFQGRKINQIFINASRQQELDQLMDIRWGVTIALEIRDALAPRLRTLIALFGRGVVYVLTQVIGRGIGLIGRGIIQGIGNSLQETRYRNTQQVNKTTNKS